MPGVSKQDGFLAEIILDFAFLPHGFCERCIVGERLVNAVKQSESYQIWLRFLNPKEMLASAVWKIGCEVMNKRTIQHAGSRMFEGLRKCLKNGEVSRAFQIKRPTFEFRLIILIKTNVCERFDNLLASVVNAMGRADESNHNITIGGFVKNDLRVAGSNYLLTLARSQRSNALIN